MKQSALLARLPTVEQIEAERARRSTEQRLLETQRNAQAIRKRCKTLAGFVREAWRVLEPTATYVHGWHIDAICEHLEAVTRGEITRLLINVPPGSMKSLLVSVLWPAWEWGPCGRTSLRYLTTAFNDGPVKRDTRKSRDLILSDWYQALWPEVVLTRTGETSFANDNTGTREGVAFGSLTSQRADRLIIDDPHSTETAESEAERIATTRKFREGATNRLNNQDRSAIVVIMQRLHANDVSGTILALKMGYVHLCLPMEFETARRCETVIGFKDPRVGEGDLLEPIRFGRKVVSDLKRDMGSYAYAGQYQQRPAPRDGGLFKRGWFEFVGAVPANCVRCRGWDLAASKQAPGKQPDWTAGVRVARSPGKVFYVEHVNRFRGSPSEVKRTILNTATHDGLSTRIRIPQDPGQAGKAQAETFIKDLAGYTAIAKPVTGDKSTRASPAAAQAEAGNVKILRTGDPNKDAWIEPFLDELCGFPTGSFDDQVDGFADALNELALGSSYTLAHI
jgi:predicted phage terminase large subunit-like protein